MRQETFYEGTVRLSLCLLSYNYALKGTVLLRRCLCRKCMFSGRSEGGGWGRPRCTHTGDGL